MSDDLIILDSDDEVANETPQTNYAIISDLDSEDDLGGNKGNANRVNDDAGDDYLEIFGLPKKAISKDSTNRLTISSHQASSPLFVQPAAREVDNIIELDNDFLETSNANIPQADSSFAEPIFIDDEDSEDNGANNTNETFNKNSNNNSFIRNSTPSKTTTNNIYPSSSPNINRSINLIDLNHHEDPHTVTFNNTKQNKSSQIDTSSSIVVDNIPLPFPIQTPQRRTISAARERANIDNCSSPSLRNVSSSTITPIKSTSRQLKKPQQSTKSNRPSQQIVSSPIQAKEPYNIFNNSVRAKSTAKVTKAKKASSKATSKIPVILTNVSNSMLNINSSKNKESSTSAKSSRSSTNVFETERAGRRPSSDISEFSSSLNEIRYNNEKILTDEELKEKTKYLKKLQKKKDTKVKNIISDLADVRNNRADKKTKYSRIANSTSKVAKRNDPPNVSTDDSIEVSNNSSTLETNKQTKFMDIVTDHINLYSDERLDYMLERAKQFDSQRLKKVNQSNYSKDELTAKITCCFANTLNAKLELLNKDYSSHLNPSNFEVIDDTLPVIRFKRYVDCVLYKKKSTFVPIQPRQLYEDFIILLYEAKDLIDLFKTNTVKRHINTLKKRYPHAKFSLWVLGYDQYLQALKTKVNRAYKAKVQEQLNMNNNGDTTSTAKTSSKRKTDQEEYENMIKPEHIMQKLLRYEVTYDFSFQSFKGLKDFLEWLKSIAYTLSSKYIDYMERQNGIANVGKVKSADSPESCLIMMLSQIKGMTEARSKKFVEMEGYKSVGDLYDDVIAGKDMTRHNGVRTDHQRLIKKMFNALNENDLLN